MRNQQPIVPWLAGGNIAITGKVKSIDVILHKCLTFEGQVRAINKASHHHARAIRHIQRSQQIASRKLLQFPSTLSWITAINYLSIQQTRWNGERIKFNSASLLNDKLQKEHFRHMLLRGSKTKYNDMNAFFYCRGSLHIQYHTNVIYQLVSFVPTSIFKALFFISPIVNYSWTLSVQTNRLLRHIARGLFVHYITLTSLLLSNWNSHIDSRLAYLYLTFAYSSGNEHARSCMF